MDLKPDSSRRGWLHIDPGQCESGSTLTTSVGIGRIQEVQWKSPQSVSSLLHLKQPTHQSISVMLTLITVVIPQATLDVLMKRGLQNGTRCLISVTVEDLISLRS